MIENHTEFLSQWHSMGFYKNLISVFAKRSLPSCGRVIWLDPIGEEIDRK